MLQPLTDMKLNNKQNHVNFFVDTNVFFIFQQVC